MKITNISCTQFAGVRDRSVSFTDGINVIYGKNESGKSTLVNLLSRTLFQNARLDRRSDKEFFELYFPGSKKGSSMKRNRSINPRYRKVVVPGIHTAENHDFISSDQGSRSSISKSLLCSARSGNMLSR